MNPIDNDRRAATFDAAILGAGISGLVSASVLLQQGCKSILIVDAYDHVGGNHIDRRIGDYTFDIGSFIFQDDSPLLKHFPELLRRYIHIKPSWARLNPQGRVARYPISVVDDIIAPGPIEWVRIAASVVLSRLFRRKLANAEDFATYWIGRRLLKQSGLAKYMERFYGVPPDQIDLKFAEQRMKWIRVHASLRHYISDLRHKRTLPLVAGNKQLARPREGFDYLYAVSRQKLEAQGVMFQLGAQLRSVAKTDGDTFVLETGDGRVRARRLVSTIPLPNILDLCGIDHQDDAATVTMISLFFSFSGERGFSENILYNFSHDSAWKRLTVYSDSYGEADGRQYFTVEVNAEHVAGSIETAEADFRKHIAANGLFVGDLRLEGSHTTAHAYPIYSAGAGERAARAISQLGELGIESFGRQGAFDYQPTARDTTLKAEIALKPD